jgi:hypothetical protein
MLKIFHKFNKWYDALSEPWRFLLIMFPMSVAIFLTGTSSPILIAIGFIIDIAIVIFAFTRIFYSTD